MDNGGLFTRVHDFIVSPLSSSPRDLFLIVGILFVIVFLWTRVLKGIEAMI